MSETIWQGGDVGNEGDVSIAGNWSNGLPSASNEAIANSGSQDMNAGLDQSAGASWKSLHVGSGYTGKIASSIGYLIVKIIDKFIFEGAENAYVDCSNLALPYLKVRSDGTSKGLYFKCGTGATDCDLMWIQKGYVWHVLGTVVKTVMESWTLISADANLTLTAGTLTLVEKQGGTFTQDGGTCTQLNNRTGGVTINAGTLTNFESSAGITRWETTTTIASAKIWGGKFDASGDERARTITHIEMHGDAEVDLDNGKDNITLTDGGVHVYGSKSPRLGSFEVGDGGGIPV